MRHFYQFERIKPESEGTVSSRQLRKGVEGLVVYLSSLPRETLQEEWEWNGDLDLINEYLKPFIRAHMLEKEYSGGFP